MQRHWKCPNLTVPWQINCGISHLYNTVEVTRWYFHIVKKQENMYRLIVDCLTMGTRCIALSTTFHDKCRTLFDKHDVFHLWLSMFPLCGSKQKLKYSLEINQCIITSIYTTLTSCEHLSNALHTQLWQLPPRQELWLCTFCMLGLAKPRLSTTGVWCLQDSSEPGLVMDACLWFPNPVNSSKELWGKVKSGLQKETFVLRLNKTIKTQTN
jgi:hypothetical protein